MKNIVLILMLLFCCAAASAQQYPPFILYTLVGGIPTPATGSGAVLPGGNPPGFLCYGLNGSGQPAPCVFSGGTNLVLTTNGTSGASTYNSGTGVLNIPQYSGGGGGVDSRPTSTQTTGKLTSLATGGSVQIFNVAPGNAGTITHFHLTIGITSGSDGLNLIENSTLQIACDGSLQFVPLGLFMMTQDAPVPFNEDNISAPSVFNSFMSSTTVNRKVWIDFTNGCTVTLYNASTLSSAYVWIDVTYRVGAATTDAASMKHWNAQYNYFPSVPPNTGVWDYPQIQLLPTITSSGGGMVESMTEWVNSANNLTYLEASPTIYTDGNLAVVANGGEDFFGCGYYCAMGALSITTDKWGFMAMNFLQFKTNPYDFLGYRFFTDNASDNVPFASTLQVNTANSYPGFSPGNVGIGSLVTYFTAAAQVSPTLQPPSMSPPAGTYTGTQAVTLTSIPSNAVLCYTTNGSTPTATGGSCTAGTTYTGPFNLTPTATYTVKAIASIAGIAASSTVTSQAYTINASGGLITPTGSCSNYLSSTQTSISCSFTGTGNTEVIFGSQLNVPFTSVSSTCGGTPTTVRTSSVWETNWYTEAIVIAGTSTGSCTVTMVLPNSGFPFLQVQEYSGANGTSPVDNASCTSTPFCTSIGTSGTTLTPPAITTANANEMVISLGIQLGGSVLTQSGSGYTFVVNSSSSQTGILYGLETSTGSYTPVFSGTVSGGWLAMSIALKP